MTGLSAELLTLLVNDGYVVLVAVVLVGALGAPLPSALVLLAAGGFAAEGDLNVALVVPLTVAAAVVGDCTVFLVARSLGAAAVQRYGRRVGLGPDRIEAARERVERWTWLAVFLTRWLFTPIAAPIGVLAGIGRYPVLAFASGSLAGETLWAAIYVGAGFAFGRAWSQVAGIVGDGVGLLAGLVIAAVAAAIGVNVAGLRVPSVRGRPLAHGNDKREGRSKERGRP